MNKIKRYIIALFTYAYLVLFSLLAFAQPSDNSVNDNNTISLSVHISPAAKAAFFPLIQQFEQQSGIKVKIVKYTKDDEFEQLNNRWLVDGIDSPDILYAHASHRFHQQIKAGYAHSISHLWQKHLWEEKFATKLIDWVSYQGQIYGLPYVKATWGFFYKTSLTERFGEVPQQWQEFITYCQTLKDAGITPFNASKKQPWIATAWFEYFILRQYGIGLFNEIIAGEINYHDPRIQHVLNLWADLIARGFFNYDYNKMRWSDSLPLFHRQRFAFFFMSQRLSSDLVSQALIDNTQYMAFPKMADIPRYESTPTLVFFISKHSKNKLKAERFLTFLATSEAQKHIAEQYHMLPANNKSSEFNNKFSIKGFEIASHAADVSPFFDRATAPEFEKIAVKAFGQFLQDGNVYQLTETLEQARKSLF